MPQDSNISEVRMLVFHGGFVVFPSFSPPFLHFSWLFFIALTISQTLLGCLCMVAFTVLAFVKDSTDWTPTDVTFGKDSQNFARKSLLFYFKVSPLPPLPRRHPRLFFFQSPFSSCFQFIETWSLEAWREAHYECVVNGMACFIVAALLPHFYLRTWTQRIIGTLCVIAAYSNILAKIICAVYNVHGHSPAGSTANVAAFALNFLALVTTVLDLIMLMGTALLAVAHRDVEHVRESTGELAWSSSGNSSSGDINTSQTSLDPPAPQEEAAPPRDKKVPPHTGTAGKGITKRKSAKKMVENDGTKKKSFEV